MKLASSRLVLGLSPGPSCQRWWTLMAAGSCALLVLLETVVGAGAEPVELHYKMFPQIDAEHTSTDLLFEPSLESVSKPGYAFAYGVEDPFSGSAQSHQEERDGDVVRGEYKVLEADGSLRTVTYTVDPKRGFQANVEHSDPDLSAPFSAYSDRQQLQRKAHAAQAAQAAQASRQYRTAPRQPDVFIGFHEFVD